MAETVEKDISGDGSELTPYYIEDVDGLEYDAISMNFSTMKAEVRIY